LCASMAWTGKFLTFTFLKTNIVPFQNMENRKVRIDIKR
jgi:hypothetical protein